MELTFTEQIKIVMKRKKITVADLAGRLGVTRQALNQKFLRGNFTENDMIKTAAAVGYDVVIELKEKPQTLVK